MAGVEVFLAGRHRHAPLKVEETYLALAWFSISVACKRQSANPEQAHCSCGSELARERIDATEILRA
ncbi:hypothetical protein PCL1606_41280 [Pseudomonas chlororaphis]|uniref:Uncharacterized protein n=1 Tax=Pseudomonas chlororaphis TaxID=587753 RepID=A0A0D5Y2I5_9PSED|nr:hypothetical protein PCL1606_41280 [Pseudomonas chlororaphis]